MRIHARFAWVWAATLTAPLYAMAAETPAPAPQSLEARVAKIERLLDSQALVEMLNRLESLQQQVQRLQGEAEVTAHELEDLKAHQRELYLDIDQRLRKLESVAPPMSSAAIPEGNGNAPSVPAAPVAVNPPSDSVAYQQAFGLLKDGHYDEAITALRAYIATYPSGAHVDNAEYWLGEAYYVTHRYREASEEFTKVVVSYPNSQKLPDSLLKLGYTRYELGEWDQARKQLEEVVGRYPNTTAANLAQNRLERMRAEGH